MTYIPGASTQALQPASNKNKRPYVRKHTTNSSGLVFPTSPPQLSEFAFNVHGWALEDGVVNRGTFEVINAYKATMIKGGFEAKINELKIGGQVDVYRNDLGYTPRELDTTLADRDSAVCQYLVVGYTLQEEDPIFVNNKDFSRYSDNELVGEAWPSGQHLINWDSCRTPILVVTPIKENTGTSVRLFGLVQPRSGLCQPVLLTHERIFYRWEFRASAGAKFSQRNKNWNHLIIEKARLLTPPENTAKEEEGSERRRPAKRTRSGAVIKQEDKQEADMKYIQQVYEALDAQEAEELQDPYLELNLNLSSLIRPRFQRDFDANFPTRTDVMSNIKVVLSPPVRGIITAIRTSKTDRVIQEIRSALTKVNMPREIPPEKAACLLHFSFLNTNFGLDEAQVASDEIKLLWPELSYLVDADRIMRLKLAMNNSGLVVALETMKTFFANALAYLAADFNITDQVLSVKLNDFRQVAVVLYQSRVAMASTPPPIADDAIYLLTLLRDFLNYDLFQIKAIEPGLAQGRLAIPPTLFRQSWEYTLEFEVAERRNEIDTTVRDLFEYAESKNCGLEDILLWLERLRIHIRLA